MSTYQQEIEQHKVMQRRMVAIAKRMMESKRQLQQEIKDDMKQPEIRAAVDELKKRYAQQP